MNNFNKIEQVVNCLIAQRNRPLTDKEQKIIDDWLTENPKNKQVYDSLQDETNISPKLEYLLQFNKDKAYSNFAAKTKKYQTQKVYRNFIKYAAILIPFLFIVSWLLFQNAESSQPVPVLSESEIQPGTSRAILKLDNGSVINLQEKKDLIAEYNETTVTNQTGKITYNKISPIGEHNKIQYNTIEIPRGGEYQLILSDGTKVWLNSETAVKFPVDFADNKREVSLLKGEAFFEVTKNKQRPFIVHTSKIDVKVLGTSFNVRAYPDEDNQTTTLVEGKVAMRYPDSEKNYNLYPNEQANISGSSIAIEKVNVEKYIAWKNGKILFEDNTLEEIFKELGRWYDIETVFKNQNARELRFSIDIERYKDLNKILDILLLTQKVKFEVNGKKVIIK